MHFECHAILGWAIGNVGGGNRRVRAWCLAAAVLPDLDAIPFVFGPRAYEQWHHTFGHNVFLLGVLVFAAAWRVRETRAAVLVFLSFGSHLLTDAYFSGWALYLFWPFSREGYVFANAVELHHPVNIALLYLGFAVVVALGFIYKRTPLELISQRLDQLLVLSLQRAKLRCAGCGKGTNHRCEACGRPSCVRHSMIRRGWTLVCARCAGGKTSVGK